MATYANTPRTSDGSSNGHATLPEWRAASRIFLQPIAAPSILGLFGFAAATFMVAANLAGWYGTPHSGIYLFPFAATFGGLAQFLAGMWAFRARDALATAMHGMWGAFWLAYGILNLLAATHAVTLPAPGAHFQEFGYWFLMLAAITGVGAIAALAENLGLSLVLLPLAVGSAFTGIGWLVASTSWLHTGGWVLIASAIIAFYAASAMLLESSYGRTILPTGRTMKEGNVPGHHPVEPIEFEYGEPGVKRGQ
jgi:succinate-acetate transporter protein